MRRAFSLLIALAIAATTLSGCGKQGTTGITKEQAARTAEEHLRRYGHYPPVVVRVEVEEGEGEANRYWERFGEPPIESPPKQRCWIVRFYYPGPCEGSHLTVYVDKESSEVIGGTQTR
ncbi:MAG: hypothetical protein DRI52_11570 [Chloroflexi bacterium]|nr:MAG: hypothetical protein DRI52_11570 [Chloroflexota bacterium]